MRVKVSADSLGRTLFRCNLRECMESCPPPPSPSRISECIGKTCKLKIGADFFPPICEIWVNRDLQIGVRVRDLAWGRLFKPSAYTLDYHISHQSCTDTLLFSWSATGRSEGSNWIEIWKSYLYSIAYSYSNVKVPNTYKDHGVRSNHTGLNTIKGMAPPTFHIFRAWNANLYPCIHGKLLSQAFCKQNPLQNFIKPNDTLDKKKMFFANVLT